MSFTSFTSSQFFYAVVMLVCGFTVGFFVGIFAEAKSRGD